METKTLTSTAIWYHISSAKGDSASRWAKGAARKGIYNGQSSLSMILFDAEAIREAIGTEFLQEADLVISRDSVYGTDPVTVCVAPAYITGMDETYMSRSACIGMAKRNMHKCHVVEGDTATFHIPGATLKAMWADEVNAFLLYQELDGSDSYCKFGDSAELRLKVGHDMLATPVWTRTISAGDTICSEIYSHLADLREIEYYIALRNQFYNYTGIIVWSRSMQDYGGWSRYINRMREQAETFLEDEQRTYDWIPIPEGRDPWNAWDSPNADVLNNLRGVFTEMQDNRHASNGLTMHQFYTKANETFRDNVPYIWVANKTLEAGKIKKDISSSVNGIYQHSVCAWIFNLGNISINNATLELTITNALKAMPRVVLYPIVISTAPVGSAAYNTVFGTTVIGTGECAHGETSTIKINAAGIKMLNDREIYGVGIRYDNDYVKVQETATLIVNVPEEEAET